MEDEKRSITEVDVFHIEREILLSAAQALGIIDAPLMTNDELLDEIEQLDDKMYNIVSEYIDVHYQLLELQNEDGIVEPEYEEEAKRLAEERNKLRNAFKEYLSKLQS
ncbi:MAG: hypothetical protein D6707_11730 [Bacteroidetes bacterium]|nr:MAG: hypothetical protein D6707_11730 [Bacteroidota bacterium]